MIKQEIVDDILARTDIETLIGGYVSLKRAGSNLKGLCPFHSEKSPSFTVFPQNNSFYCFGCGIGGDSITFVKQMEHLDYPDALEFLAKRAGITIVLDEKDTPAFKKVDKARFYAMNIEAAKYFHRALLADNPPAKAALAYFTEKRRLSMATIKHFGLGYAPDSYSDFTDYMVRKGFTKEELCLGFLTGKSEKGHYYDAFRNRVMFPIIDVAGNIIAFGGRVMDDSKPKYKNSSDTPVFKKLRNLFALNFARTTCAETMILCEGYMDVIALHSAGFTNAVATLGTAINADQARLMSRYTKKVIICYDADEAGQKAAARALPMLEAVGLEVNVLKIPGAKDPDEYIKEFGAEKFKEVLEHSSKTKFEYNMDKELSAFDLDDQQDRILAAKKMVELISGFYSNVEREVYIRAVSEKLKIDPKSLAIDVERQVKINNAVARKNESASIIQKTAGFGDRVNADYAKAPAAAKNEEAVLGLLLLFAEHRKKVFEGNLLTEADFFTDLNRRVFLFVKENYQAGDTAFDINEKFTPEEVGRITKMKLTRLELTENGDNVLEDAIASLKASVKKKQEAPDSLEALLAMIESKRAN